MLNIKHELRLSRPSSLGALLFALCLVVASCGGPDITAPGGIPIRTETACAYDQNSTELGASETPFTCRGALFQVGGSLFGLTRIENGKPYLVIALDAKGNKTAEAATPHVGKPRVLEMPSGFVLISKTDEGVTLSSHNTQLESKGTLQLALGEDEELIAFDVAAYPSKGAKTMLIVGAGTETDVRIWTLTEATIAAWMEDPSAAVASVKVLAFPEMSDCSSLKLMSTGEGAWAARLRCESVMPASPAIEEGVASVPSFDEESDDLPDYADIVLNLNASLKVRSGSALAVDELEPKEDPSYLLKKFMTDELPRPEGFRVRVLDALPIGDDKVITLACMGPDEKPATLISASLTCKERP